MLVNVTYRTGRLVKKNVNGISIDEWESKTETCNVNNADELFALYNPRIKSQGLVNAVCELLNGKRTKIEYNFGKGNALFIVNGSLK